ncbi:phage tail tape measure protein [Campylobacter jejuni]|nr:phage tail tape measure protein [Campylobacter jejuni]EAK2109063.1 phage tail tape measure protein [Campylobacter jejuni]EAL7061348.1 phage tail tape measure protein [Campylobacter jejuni]EHR9968462.1 phage tail tape measure protein [Campylobacter jejuni]NBE34213.1 phage tail tape measure protein [Campylobacter jejuni]NBE86475.1 phage tail tape measure protein [Campylobacter jejuni]
MQDLGLSFGISLAFKGFKEFAKNTEALKKFSANLNQSTKSVKALNKSIDALEKSKLKIKEVSETLGSLKGELMAKGASALAISVPVKISANLEDDMNNINTFLNADNESLKSLRLNFLKLSSNIKMNVNDLTKFGELGARLGIKSEKELLAFSEIGAKYSQVFKLNNEESINFMSKLSNIYKLNTKDMQGLGDKIISVARASNVSASSVAKTMNEVGGDAKLIGMNAEATAALSAAFVSATKDEGEAVGTFKAMTAVMSNLNNISDDMKAKFLKLGLSTEQLGAYFKQDASEAVKMLLNQIKTLPKDEMTDFLNSVFGTGAAGMMQNLVDNTDKYENALKSLKNTKMGALNDEFKKISSSTNSSFTQLSTSMSNLSASIGEALAPALVKIMDSISSLINFIREMIDAFPNLSKVVGTLVVALTTASVALSALKVGFLVAKLAGIQFAFTINTIRIAFNILKVAFLTNPIGLALMAIAAIATLVMMNWDKVKTFFISFIEKISSAFSAFGDFFKGIWQGIGEFFSSLWDSLFGWFSSKFEWLSNAFSKIKDIARSVASFFGFNEKENITNNESNEIKQNEVRNSLTSKKSIETKTSNAVNVNVNGTFNISSNNGVFDLKAFAKEVEMSVLNALNKNADKTKQTTIWG